MITLKQHIISSEYTTIQTINMHWRHSSLPHNRDASWYSAI